MLRIFVVGLLGGGALLILVSLAFITEATLGVGIIGIACFSGICARIIQAAIHQMDNQTKPKDIKVEASK